MYMLVLRSYWTLEYLITSVRVLILQFFYKSSLKSDKISENEY